ncbi:hypothetical protein CPB85DRAFT_1317802 [Mucidula mucida]|nr:hypothetical protein CPB85DRAFT_1317802 [Mucidula mucida]
MHVSESVVESAENRVVLLQNIHASTETQAGDLMTAISGLATSIKSLSDTVDARFDDMDKRFETMDKRFETMEATTEETFGKVEARLRDFEDIVQERLDKMDAKADNFLKRFYNIHSLIPTGKLTYMLHKTVPGCGYERARNLLPDSRIGSYLTHMAPLDQEPALGAVINLDISLFDAWNHGDILQCMTFYNEDFKIIAPDTLVERKAKLRAWLTVG